MSLSNGRWFINLLYFMVVIMNINNLKVQRLLDSKKQTSHVFHLLMCIPTVGLWLFVWILMILINTLRNYNIERKIDNVLDQIKAQENIKTSNRILG